MSAHDPEAPPEPGEVAAPLLDLLQRPLVIRSLALTALSSIAVVHLLHFAREFLIPIFIAVLLQFLLSPLVRKLERMGVGAPLAAGILVVGTLGGLGYLAASLAGPAQRWFEELPELVQDAGGRLDKIRGPVEAMQETAKKVDDLADLDQDPDPFRREVVVQAGPTTSSRILGGAGNFLAQALITVALLFFLLATYDSMLRKVVGVLPTLTEKKVAVEVVRGVEEQISRYILSISAINAVLGVVVGLGLYFQGLPNAALWGAMAAVLNFVPYVGALVGAGVIGLVGVVSFDGMGAVVGAVAFYLGATTIEGSFLTPLVLGNRFRVSPVAVFLWFLFWVWIWGVPGGLLAMPMLVAVKILCDNVPALRVVGALMDR